MSISRNDYDLYKNIDITRSMSYSIIECIIITSNYILISWLLIFKFEIISLL